jgi:hypothetical protein
MNKENQKKFKKYQQIAVRIKKSQAKVDKLYEAYEKVTNDQAAAISQVEKKFAPKLKKAYESMANLRDDTELWRSALSAIRKSLVSSDNPDRKELIDILIKD